MVAEEVVVAAVVAAAVAVVAAVVVRCANGFFNVCRNKSSFS